MSEPYAVIPLTRGKVAFLDVTSLPLVEHLNWYVVRPHGWYASATTGTVPNRRTYKMHRLILGLSSGDGILCDHKNGNTLDNRRRNLRVSTASQNAANAMIRKDNSSGFKGVKSVRPDRNKGKPWLARISVNGRRRYLGYFKTAEDAAWAYDLAAVRYHGEFARCNFILPKEAM